MNQVQRMHVLVADDDDNIRDLLRAICTMAGYEVESARDGAEALEILLRANEPWIVLLDVMMPRLTGPEVCSRLMAAGGVAAKHLVLLMTAGIFPDGDPPPPAWAILGKPFEVSMLVNIMARLAHRADHQSDADLEDVDTLYINWVDRDAAVA